MPSTMAWRNSGKCGYNEDEDEDHPIPRETPFVCHLLYRKAIQSAEIKKTTEMYILP